MDKEEMVLQYIKNYFHLKKEMDALDITMEDGKIIEKIYLYIKKNTAGRDCWLCYFVF